MMMKVFVYFMLLAAEGSLEILHRLNTIPLDFLLSVFGNHESPFGGVVFPLESRLVAGLARPPFLAGGFPLAETNAECRSLWERHPHWQIRADIVMASPSSNRDQPFLSFVSSPSELTPFTAEELTCLYFLGYTPSTVPTGMAYGRVLHILGNNLIKDISKLVWGGKMFMQTHCKRDGDPIYVAINHVNQSPSVWGQIYIAPKPTGHYNHFHSSSLISM
eukprot:Protomagalhaensia_sp_Gyna_25__2339@NODE_228_length_4268_cov_30_310002_g178_i0_p3_GENE_NODE_228_length_4268_cov_30_310002_g178_i0NODE_228_length_4268_cov_30_310002_g178_i0_p3_ORF_typecomplete_len219_score30_88_NODE_228_length_4268_cov_30_310002_g178_i04701126